MGTISTMVQQCRERIWHNQMRLDELTQLGLGDVADHFCERCMMYGTAQLRVRAVLNPKTHTTGATLPPTTIGEHSQTHDNVPGQSQIPQGTPQPGCSQMRQGCDKPQTSKHIASLLHDAVHISSSNKNWKCVEPLSLYPCI